MYCTLQEEGSAFTASEKRMCKCNHEQVIRARLQERMQGTEGEINIHLLLGHIEEKNNVWTPKHLVALDLWPG